jgi:uncharacterized membrane protein YgdD (TMEM256/DUF423 family)
MRYKQILLVGILFSALAVGLGAFGAHGLKELLEANQRGDTFQLAVRYHFYHAFAILFVGILQKSDHQKLFGYAAACFILGILFFSGSLYILSFTDITKFGAITPIGGLFFIAGWILFAFGLVSSRSHPLDKT